jgi:hypothetical protein
MPMMTKNTIRVLFIPNSPYGQHDPHRLCPQGQQWGILLQYQPGGGIATDLCLFRRRTLGRFFWRHV